MDHPHDAFNSKLLELIENVPVDLESQETTTAMKNLEVFSKCRPPAPEPEPIPDPVVDADPVPPTRWERVKAGIAAVWDNETTRVSIKALGTLTGVGLVTYTTVHRDKILDRQALNQANQSNN